MMDKTRGHIVSQQMLFEIERLDDVCVLHISGRLASGADTNYLWTKEQEIKSLGCPKIVADVGKLDSIGSAGIGFFVSLHTSTSKIPAGRFVLAGPSPRVLEVLALTGLSKIISMAEDLPAGLLLVRGQDPNTKEAKSKVVNSERQAASSTG